MRIGRWEMRWIGECFMTGLPRKTTTKSGLAELGEPKYHPTVVQAFKSLLEREIGREWEEAPDMDGTEERVAAFIKVMEAAVDRVQLEARRLDNVSKQAINND